MQRILIASSNPAKAGEFKALIPEFGFEIVTPGEAQQAYDLSPPPIVTEGSDDYYQNALAKALAFAEWSGLPALGDDTGLEVDALHGAPGPRTARYAGDDVTTPAPSANRDKLLHDLRGVSDRAARFVCVLVLSFPGRLFSSIGILGGSIVDDAGVRGEAAHGFGYDSIFLIPPTGKTLAELSRAPDRLGGSPFETHRAKALRSLFRQLSDGSATTKE